MDRGIGYRLCLVATQIKIALRRMFVRAGFDVTPEQWSLLLRLHEGPGQIQSELADRTVKDKTTITRILDRLEHKGLAERRRDPNDRRTQRLFLTPRGEAVLAELMNNAAAVFNLLRNLGGSFGVAFVTTLLARRAQFHQARLIEHLTPYDLTYQTALQQAKDYLAAKYLGLYDVAGTAGAALYKLLLQQANAMAFYDVFHAQGLMFLGLAVLMWIIKKPPIGAAKPEELH